MDLDALRRFSRSAIAAGVAALLGLAPQALAQPQAWSARPTEFRGRVRGADSTPIANARVTVTSVDSGGTATTSTDARGLYRLLIQSFGGSYLVQATAVGYAPEWKEVVRRENDTTATIVDFVFSRRVPTLETVRTTATRRRATHDDRGLRVGPGDYREVLDLTSGLSGDLTGDLAASLAAFPGISLIPDATGGASTVSAFGLGPDQNGVTLNGVEFSGPSAPRDGLVGAVHFASYDPKYGRHAGVEVSWNLPSGSSTPQRSLHATVDDPNLQWAPSDATRLGSSYRNLIVSGTASGPLIGGHWLYSAAYQAGRLSSQLPSLSSTPPGALRTLGISADSVDRLIASADSAGLPITAPGIGVDRTATSGSAIARVDLTPGASRSTNTSDAVAYLLGAASWKEDRGLGAGPTALATRASRSTRQDVQLLGHHSTYVLSALSETKSSISMRSENVAPAVQLPSASVLVTSTASAGRLGTTSLLLGGNGGAQRSLDVRRWETSNETSWYTWNRRHNIRAYTDFTIERFAFARAPNAFGAFRFNSLADLAAGEPAAFSRTLAPERGEGRSWRGTFGLSDVYVRNATDGPLMPGHGNTMTVQYGVRADVQRFGEPGSYDATIDSAFGRRTNRIPALVTLSPMLGVTWTHGLYLVQTGPGTISVANRSAVTAGIREYRGALSTFGVEDVLRRGSGVDTLLDINCIGAAAPLPDWNAYRRAEADIPTRCNDGALGNSIAQRGRSGALYSPGFSPSRSVRGELRWNWLVSGQLGGSVGTVQTFNSAQVSPFDLNFSGVQRFSIEAEDGRPVYASSNSVVGNTGALLSAESRRVPGLTHVTELRSDLRSRQSMFTASLTKRIGASAYTSTAASAPPRTSGSIAASYSFVASRMESTGFSETTAGDPRTVIWSPGATPRHTLGLTLRLQRDRRFSLAASARFASGARYSPMIATDMNGDGFANDRAFVFDPRHVLDTSLANGMQALLSTSPRQVHDCLARQTGHIAGVNSCEAPWSAQIGTISLTMDPYLLHLGNRGSLTVYANNVLGGIDQLLHGPTGLRGWGQQAVADRPLLYVRGFAGNRFLYTVNPLFGSTKASQTVYRSPLRVTVDFRFDIGPDRESQALARLMSNERERNGGALDSARLQRSLMSLAGMHGGYDIQIVLRNRDSLRLTDEQIVNLDALNSRYLSSRDSIYAALAGFLASWPGEYGAVIARERWHSAVESSARLTFATGDSARAMLSTTQFRWLRVKGLATSLEHSPDWLERLARGPLLIPW